jgi:branched-chain amino acid transport system permease protein
VPERVGRALLPRRTVVIQAARLKPYRNELAILAGLFAVTAVLPKRSPLGVYVQGLGSGSLLAFHAVAVVLVYRTNRFLNLAQVQFAAFASTLFAGLVNGATLARFFSPKGEPGPLARDVNFAVALVLTMAITMGLSWLTYQTVIRRFHRAPRVMPTLVTVFIALTLQSVDEVLIGWLQPLRTVKTYGEGTANGPAAGPLKFAVTLGTIRLESPTLFALILAPLAVLAILVYLRWSAAGTAIRAAGENPDRAATLGLDVFGVTSRVWLLVGGLAGLAGILDAFSIGAPVGAGRQVALLPVGTLVMMLAAAVIGRFVNLPLVLAAALALAVLRTSVQWSAGSPAPFEAALVVIVAVALLLQRERTGRVRREETLVSEVTREPRPVPPELRDLPAVRQWRQTGFSLLAVLLLGLPWVLNAGQTSLAGAFLAEAVVGLSLLILTGWAGQISLGQWGFAAIGGWVAAVSGLPLPIALVVAGAAGAAASVVVGLPALKLRGLQLAIATLAFAWSVSVVLFDKRYLGSWVPAETKGRSLFGLNLVDQRAAYYATLGVLALFVVATIGLRRSRFGRALIAVRSNEEGAESFGIEPRTLRLTAFAVAGAYAAMAGALFAAQQGGARPDAFIAQESIQIFMITVIGGLGGVAGPLFGFGFLGLITLASSNPLVVFLGTGLGGLLMLISAPGGLAEVFYRLRDNALRRLAIRHRIAASSLLGDRAALRLREHALLREHAGGRGPVLPPERYELPGQWALSRFGDVEATEERVGATAASVAGKGSGR